MEGNRISSLTLSRNWLITSYSLFLLLGFLPIATHAIQRNLGVFDTLKTVEYNERSTLARNIFLNKLRKLDDSNSALTQLDALHEYALETDNKKLELAYLWCKAEYAWEHLKNGHLASIKYYREAIILCQENDMDHNVIKLYNILGTKLLHIGEYQEGFNYVLQSAALIEEEGIENFDSSIINSVVNTGWAYGLFSNQDRAIQFYQRALSMPNSDPHVTAAIFIDLGVAYLEINQNDSAMYYLERAYNLSIENNDTNFMAITAVNMGDAYLRKGWTELSRPMLNKALLLSEKLRNWRYIGSTLLNLALADLVEEKWSDARQHAIEARKLLVTKDFLYKLSLWKVYYQVMAEVRKHENNLALANATLDSLIKTKDSLTTKKNAYILTNLETQLNAEKYLAKMKAVELEKNKERLLRNGIIVLAVLVLIIFYLIYSKWALRRRQKLELSLMEKEKEIEREKSALYKVKEQLADYTDKLREKSNIIEQIQNDIETFHPDYADHHEEIKQRKFLKDKLLSTNILTEDDWTEFKVLFERVHEGFFSKVLNDYPALTIAEVRYLALAKLGMTSNEMAGMLGISPDSVKRSIRRLRSKIHASSLLHFDELVKNL